MEFFGLFVMEVDTVDVQIILRNSYKDSIVNISFSVNETSLGVYNKLKSFKLVVL